MSTFDRCLVCGSRDLSVNMQALQGGGYICRMCTPTKVNYTSVLRCQSCGTYNGVQPYRVGLMCQPCYNQMTAQMQQPPRQQRITFYPGSKIPFTNAWNEEIHSRISSETVHWKQNLEQLGIPWNFYEALVTAAKALASNKMDLAKIDKDGWLNIQYEDIVIKMKITEITVEPIK